jgi:hypothetical protein
MKSTAFPVLRQASIAVRQSPFGPSVQPFRRRHGWERVRSIETTRYLNACRRGKKPKYDRLSEVLTIGSHIDSLSAPRTQQKAKARAAVPALIQDHTVLPCLLPLRNRSHLEGLYSSQHLSVRETFRLTGASLSAVQEALDRFGIP